MLKAQHFLNSPEILRVQKLPARTFPGMHLEVENPGPVDRTKQAGIRALGTAAPSLIADAAPRPRRTSDTCRPSLIARCHDQQRTFGSQRFIRQIAQGTRLNHTPAVSRSHSTDHFRGRLCSGTRDAAGSHEFLPLRRLPGICARSAALVRYSVPHLGMAHARSVREVHVLPDVVDGWQKIRGPQLLRSPRPRFTLHRARSPSARVAATSKT